jgi:hypothetical protein
MTLLTACLKRMVLYRRAKATKLQCIARMYNAKKIRQLRRQIKAIIPIQSLFRRFCAIRLKCRLQLQWAALRIFRFYRKKKLIYRKKSARKILR